MWHFKFMVNLVLSWDPGCLQAKEDSFEECMDDTVEENESNNLRNRASQVALVVKNPPAHAGDIRDEGSIPRSGGSLGGGHGNSLQYSCLENPHRQRNLAGYSHGVAKSHT